MERWQELREMCLREGLEARFGEEKLSLCFYASPFDDASKYLFHATSESQVHAFIAGWKLGITVNTKDIIEKLGYAQRDEKKD